MDKLLSILEINNIVYSPVQRDEKCFFLDINLKIGRMVYYSFLEWDGTPQGFVESLRQDIEDCDLDEFIDIRLKSEKERLSWYEIRKMYSDSVKILQILNDTVDAMYRCLEENQEANPS